MKLQNPGKLHILGRDSSLQHSFSSLSDQCDPPQLTQWWMMQGALMTLGVTCQNGRMVWATSSCCPYYLPSARCTQIED